MSSTNQPGQTCPTGTAMFKFQLREIGAAILDDSEYTTRPQDLVCDERSFVWLDSSLTLERNLAMPSSPQSASTHVAPATPVAR
jgi:hypothetical protein